MKTHFGLIAQDLQQIEPDLVEECPIDNMLGIRYVELIPFLIHKIQTQDKRINDLEAKLNMLMEKMN